MPRTAWRCTRASAGANACWPRTRRCRHSSRRMPASTCSSCAASSVRPARTPPMRPSNAAAAPSATCSSSSRPSSCPRSRSMSEAAAAGLDAVRIGIVSISDRASSGVYEDKGLPALQDWLGRALPNPLHFEPRLIPDERALIAQTLRELVDGTQCDLVLTTGGTGPSPRDVTPEATLDVAEREMPGFGEQMRQISLHFVPTAILSRQVAVIRGRSLIINLPGQPKAIAETLAGHAQVRGIFAAVPYCLDLIGGPYPETHDEVCAAFRPKSALKSTQTP